MEETQKGMAGVIFILFFVSLIGVVIYYEFQSIQLKKKQVEVPQPVASGSLSPSSSESVPKAGFIEGQSNTITKLPEPGNATSIIMDFSKCSRGSDAVYFGFGSTHFAFEGIKNNECVYYYGTEIENPMWDRSLTAKCAVPVSMGQKSYIVSAYNIQMEELREFCM